MRLLALLAASAVAAPNGCPLPAARPTQRTFISAAVDARIASLQPRFKDVNLGTLFANALPSTVDTTVLFHSPSPPDTVLITGDIKATWLRDSTNQAWPYLRFLRDDEPLRVLVAGVVRRQAANVLRAPYANAFNLDDSKPGDHADDRTKPDMSGNNWVFEAKWEVDSLANFLRLSHGYWDASGGDRTPYDATWLAAVRLALSTFRAQQAGWLEEDEAGGPAYSFQRTTPQPTDSLSHGRGVPAARTGMIKSAFRASDDATLLPFNIPENAFAAVSLEGVARVLSALGEGADAADASALAAEVRAGIAAHGLMDHPFTGSAVYAYEVDGFGNRIFMDDANIPSLLSMPMWGWCSQDDPLYLSTRAAVLSGVSNPWFLRGSAGEGVGGPHVGWPYIWPMSLIARAWTAREDGEIEQQLEMLVEASACTGFVHESFNRNNVSVYTRSWFAWANGLMGDLLLKLADERPGLLFKD